MRLTGCSSARSERLVWDQEAPSSNLGPPTTSLTLGDKATANHHEASSRDASFAVQDWTGSGLVTLGRTGRPSAPLRRSSALPRNTRGDFGWRGVYSRLDEDPRRGGAALGGVAQLRELEPVLWVGRQPDGDDVGEPP